MTSACRFWNSGAKVVHKKETRKIGSHLCRKVQSYAVKCSFLQKKSAAKCSFICFLPRRTGGT